MTPSTKILITAIALGLLSSMACKTSQPKTIEISKMDTGSLTAVKGYFYTDKNGSLYIYVSGSSRYYKILNK